jgi:hypothetical protein
LEALGIRRPLLVTDAGNPIILKFVCQDEGPSGGAADNAAGRVCKKAISIS